MGKKYATKGQKRLIVLAGGKERRGETFEEAKARIEAFVAAGRLDSGIAKERWRLEAPTKRQIEYLKAVGVPIPPGATRGGLADLTERSLASQPVSEGQVSFIKDLHGLASCVGNAADASRYIEYLLDNQPTCTNCGAEFKVSDSRCPSCGGATPEVEPIRPPSFVSPPLSQLLNWFVGLFVPQRQRR